MKSQILIIVLDFHLLMIDLTKLLLPIMVWISAWLGELGSSGLKFIIALACAQGAHKLSMWYL